MYTREEETYEEEEDEDYGDEQLDPISSKYQEVVVGNESYFIRR